MITLIVFIALAVYYLYRNLEKLISEDDMLGFVLAIAISIVIVMVGAGVARIIGGFVPTIEVQSEPYELVPFGTESLVYVRTPSHGLFSNALVREENGWISGIYLRRDEGVRVKEDANATGGSLIKVYEESDNDHWLAFFGFEPVPTLKAIELIVPVGSVR